MPPHLADLRNQSICPSYNNLPKEWSKDLCYYDNLRSVPRCHWMLLAEIIEVEAWHRPVLVVKDRTGSTFRVAFYLDEGASHPSRFLEGYTIAILYAVQHIFLDGGGGIRQESPKGYTVSVLHQMQEIVCYAVADKLRSSRYPLQRYSLSVIRCQSRQRLLTDRRYAMAAEIGWRSFTSVESAALSHTVERCVRYSFPQCIVASCKES